MDNRDETVRVQLRGLLGGGNAHQSLEHMQAGFSEGDYNRQLPGSSYTPWRLLEHIRIAQWDILEFIRNPDYESPQWPQGYWPPDKVEADAQMWQATLQAIREDREALLALLRDPQMDLYADFPHAPGYNLLREILVVADHNAYHTGEFGLLRDALLGSGEGAG